MSEYPYLPLNKLKKFAKDEIDGLDTIQKDNPEGYALGFDLDCLKDLDCTICITIIHSLLKIVRSKKVCYQIIPNKLQIMTMH